MTATPPDDPARVRPFADVLHELSKGRVPSEASTKLQELIAAVADVRKAGTLTVKIRVVPDKGTEMIRVSAAVDCKVPTRDRESLFFVDDEHNLVRDNPNQPHLPIQIVDTRKSETS